MGILTDFFIASDEELKDIFDSWLPVAMEKNKEYRNPFTGEIQLDWGPDPLALEKWVSAQRQLESSTYKKDSKQSEHRSFLGRLFRKEHPLLDEPSPDLSGVPHINYTRVDIVKLCSLYSIVSDVTFDEALNQLGKPALINPTTDAEGLYKLPSAFVAKLATLDQINLDQAVSEWVKTEELQMDGFISSDAKTVVTSLSDLAKQAFNQEKGLYHWWSL